MWLEQAVFSSSKTQRGEGYHVIAKSPGISDDIVVALTRWCPSHASLQSKEINAESLNFHPLTADLVAVSRTTYGIKEFSGRGGLQVVTNAIVLKKDQLIGYENDGFRFARVARSMGHLRWQPHFPERLSAIELADVETCEALVANESESTASNAIVDQIADVLRARKRVAVVASPGSQHHVAEQIVRRLSIKERGSYYFTTALKWSKQRAYRLQMLGTIDPSIGVLLKSHEIRIVKADGAFDSTPA